MKRAGARASQISLGLPAEPPRLGRENFVRALGDAPSPLDMLDAWRASNEPAVAISGPQGSGKTHLCSILACESGGFLTRIGEDGGLDLMPGISPEGSFFALDDIERLTRPQLLLAAIERARLIGTRIVLAGRGAPGEWAGGLRDLSTRLEAMPRVALCEPSEALIRAVIAKLFADRQLRVDASVIDFAIPRISKTFAAATAFVAAADAAALTFQSPITLSLVRRVVDNTS